MTENKRFNCTENGFVVDYESEQKVLNLYDTVDLLNELNDKNKELRKENYGFLDEIAFLNEVQIPNISKKISDLEYENEQLIRQSGNLEHTRDFCADCERLEKEYTQLSMKYNGLGLEYEGLEEENKQLKEDNNIFFGKVFDILLKYQDLFNREMADEVLDELGIELTRWFE